MIGTSGAQNGLTLVLRARTGPGDRVSVDHPTFHNALGASSRNSCQPVPISLPEAGWDLDAMDAAFRQAGPRFAYLLPDFHNPTGRSGEHTSELQSLMRNSYAVFCLEKKTNEDLKQLSDILNRRSFSRSVG